MKRVALAVVVLLGMSLATACGSGAHQQKASASAGTIVFDSTTDCDETVDGVRPNGTGLSQFLRTSSCAGVYFNENGTKAVVLQPIGHGIGPYILDLRSGKKVRVPVAGLALAIDPIAQPWSPNGKRLLLALGSIDYDRDTYIVYNPRTTGWVEVDAKTENVPVWSANGKSVLFPTAHGIEVTSINGGSKRLVRLPRKWDVKWDVDSVKPSADGKWISFLKQEQSLYVVRPDGRGLRQIADEVSTAAWSPAGERLAFENDDGVAVGVPTSGRTTIVARPPAVDPYGQGVALWSPDGKWILYAPSDLGFGAPAYGHQQLWAVQANGSGAHPVTDAFMGGTSLQATPVAWVSSDLHGTPVERPALVEQQGKPVLETRLPIVALGAVKDGVVVSTGFGRKAAEGGVKLVRAPRGPIVRRGPDGRVTELQPPAPCPTVSSLALASSQLAYICDTSRYEQGRYALRIGGKVVARAVGGQGFGSFIGGPATDGRTIAYSITVVPSPQPPHYKYRPGSTRIYVKRGSSTTLVRTLPGMATLEAISYGRIAVLKPGRHQTVMVLEPGGAAKTFRFPAEYYPGGVALAGGRLFVMVGDRLVTVDIASGRKRVFRTAAASNDAVPQLVGVHGDLAAYVLGATVHVVRLSDGREVVLDTPDATTPTLARFGAGGLFYAYNEAYSKAPGRVGFITLNALEQAISAKGRQAG